MKKSGFVYLLGDSSRTECYKIGMTKGTVEKRIRALQTGNSEDIFLVDSFHSENPYFIESSLHRYFSEKQIINEWYVLTKEEVEQFQTLCEKYEKINDSLKDNPFFKN